MRARAAWMSSRVTVARVIGAPRSYFNPGAREYTLVVATDRALCRLIDHTLLRPEALPDEIDRLCDDARAFGFRTVCVQPVFVARAARALAGTDVGVAAVVAFPHGATTTDEKVFEARRAID